MVKELKIGILGVISIVLWYFGMDFLKGSDVLSSSEDFYVVYPDVDGLATSNRVFVNGYGVGLVSDIRVLPREGNPILVQLTINSDLEIGKGTKAMLSDDGLVGGKVIRLDIDVTGPKAAEGDTLIGLVDKGLVGALSEKAGPLTNTLDSTLHQLNKLLKEYEGTSVKVNKLLESADQTAQTLNGLMAQNQRNITTITGNLSQLSGQLVETEKSLKPLIEKMQTTADSVNAMELGALVRRTDQTLQEVNQTLVLMRSSEGSVGRLLTEDSIYQAAQQTLIDLDKLLVDFRENPKRYVHFSVFGRKDKEKKKKKKN